MELVNGVVDGPVLSGSGTTDGMPSYGERGEFGIDSEAPTEPLDGWLVGVVVPTLGVSAAVAVGGTDSVE